MRGGTHPWPPPFKGEDGRPADQPIMPHTFQPQVGTGACKLCRERRSHSSHNDAGDRIERAVSGRREPVLCHGEVGAECPAGGGGARAERTALGPNHPLVRVRRVHQAIALDVADAEVHLSPSEVLRLISDLEKLCVVLGWLEPRG